MIRSLNPTTEDVLVSFTELTESEVDRRLDDGQGAFRRWAREPIGARAATARAAAQVLRRRRDALARLVSLEMGKPIAEAEAEIDKCAWTCDWFADNGERLLADEPVETDAAVSFVAFRPLGVVLAIMPWNFPFWQVFRAAMPALIAGNAVVLKHAANVPQCAVAIEDVLREAGVPAGVFQTFLVRGPAVAQLIADPRVQAVTLTGSTEAGAAVAAVAGGQLKKQVLELGGSDPFVVLRDADVDAAARTAVRARFQNSGQSCIAAKRFIVEAPVADEFLAAFVERVHGLRVGDPLDRATTIGPLARADLRDGLAVQVERSLAEGAVRVAGGAEQPTPGFFFLPSVIDHVVPGMSVFGEETFGPVAAVVRVQDEQEAIRLANDTVFGLGASLWTRDIERGQRLAGQIEAGSVFVNALVASDPRLPFGGVKRSGYGRELSSFGIREFTNIQTVWVADPGQPASPPPLVGD